jgi:hypothetical protein
MTHAIEMHCGRGPIFIARPSCNLTNQDLALIDNVIQALRGSLDKEWFAAMTALKCTGLRLSR